MTQDNKLLKVMTSKSSKLLEEILIFSHKRTVWVSTSDFREDFCRRADISSPTYFRYITMLVGAGLLTPMGNRGAYTIDEDKVEAYKNIKLTAG